MSASPQTARDELREEMSALRASVQTATARLEALSDVFQDRMLELDTLQEAVEQLKYESRAAKPPGQEIKSIFDQLLEVRYLNPVPPEEAGREDAGTGERRGRGSGVRGEEGVITTETLLLGMAVHGIVPLTGNRAQRGKVIMHAETITAACQEFLWQSEGAFLCATEGHVLTTCSVDRAAAYICERCGAPVIER